MRNLLLIHLMMFFVSIAAANTEDRSKEWSEFAEAYSKKNEVNKLTEALKTGITQILGSKGKVERGKKPKTFFRGYCYRYVKKALLRSGLTTKYLKGAKAYEAAKGPLDKEGFTDVLKDKEIRSFISTLNDLPNGTILVYNGGKAGHIEVKTHLGYISDSISERPVIGLPEKYCRKCKNKFTGRNRSLIGVYLLSEPVKRFKNPTTKLAKNN